MYVSLSILEILAVWVGCFQLVMSCRKHGEILGFHGTKIQSMGITLTRSTALCIPSTEMVVGFSC